MPTIPGGVHAVRQWSDWIARLRGADAVTGCRLAYTALGSALSVFPVNYRLDDVVVVFRAHLGTTLLAANHAHVGFYVEHIDDGTHSGWSVLIQGTAEDVTDRPGDPATERSRNLGVEVWAPGDKPRFVRIISAKVTGRRLGPTEVGFWSDERGYL